MILSGRVKPALNLQSMLTCSPTTTTLKKYRLRRLLIFKTMQLLLALILTVQINQEEVNATRENITQINIYNVNANELIDFMKNVLKI